MPSNRVNQPGNPTSILNAYQKQQLGKKHALHSSSQISIQQKGMPGSRAVGATPESSTLNIRK